MLQEKSAFSDEYDYPEIKQAIYYEDKLIVVDSSSI